MQPASPLGSRGAVDRRRQQGMGKANALPLDEEHACLLRLEEIVGPERAASVDPSTLEIWNHVDLARLAPTARAAVA